MSAYIPALAAIAVAVFTAIWGAIIYPRQKAVDRDNYAAQKDIDREEYAAQKKTDRGIELRNQRMKAYDRYLAAYGRNTNLYDATGDRPADDSPEVIASLDEYWLAYRSLFQIALDPVLLAVTDFHKIYWMHDTDLTGDAYFQKFKSLYAAMIIEMRKDAFEETELPKKIVEERIPFYYTKDTKAASAEHVSAEQEEPLRPRAPWWRRER
jgi:hypothetical protein